MLALALLPSGAAPSSAAVRLRGGTTFEITTASIDNADVLGSFKLRVARDGRSVTLPKTQIGVACTDGAGPFLNVPTTTAKLGAGATVDMTLPTNDGGNAPMRLRGRFVSSQRFVGTIGFAGGRQDPDCHSHFRLVGGVLMRYRTEKFVGRTSAGDELSFYRTVATTPSVLHLDVPSITAQCGDGSDESKRLTAYGELPIPVIHNAFQVADEDDQSEAFSFAGRFLRGTSASGTVGVSGRDDCDAGPLRWTAKRVGPGPLVTLVSH
jgi:hypothetical protein